MKPIHAPIRLIAFHGRCWPWRDLRRNSFLGRRRTAAIFALVSAIAAAVAAFALVGGQADARGGAARPLVTVTRYGGLCFRPDQPARACREALSISETTVSGDGRVPRRLRPAERLALLRAVEALNVAYLRTHLSKETCPAAGDGVESIYRFRGFPLPIAVCAFEPTGVRAIQLSERFFATLKLRR